MDKCLNQEEREARSKLVPTATGTLKHCEASEEIFTASLISLNKVIQFVTVLPATCQESEQD